MGRDVDQSTPSNAEVQNERRCNSLPPIRHYGMDRDKFDSSVADSTAFWSMTRTSHGIYVITQIRRLLINTFCVKQISCLPIKLNDAIVNYWVVS
jgi:hypothetical protein